MKQEVADLWTEALRSGDYTQATGALVDVDGSNGEIVGHCCLGVLCDLAVKAGVKVDYEGPKEHRGEYDPTDPEDVYWTGVTYDGADALLPKSVRDWAGMKTNDGSIEIPWDEPDNSEMENDWTDSLAGMNDSGKSFRQIANLIEKYRKEL